ncbi:MAG: DNA polymerase III subunit gamma/tau, partial [bacterium]|nr:DNA polymerase III subunit gamma/tau [bacterium]
MSLVLYRKHRPQIFAEVIGQEHVVKTLTNAISSGIISHAYLFAGPRGSGKTTLARLLAKSLNCQNRKEGQSEPCNKCNSCLEIMGNRSLDLIEIDAASHRGIDEMRELRDGIKFAPTKSKYKVFILDEAHQLTKEAANALLKTLEEPPSHVIFVLATTEIHKMIPTIISRCQRFDFRKLTLQEIVKRLEFIAK